MSVVVDQPDSSRMAEPRTSSSPGRDDEHALHHRSRHPHSQHSPLSSMKVVKTSRCKHRSSLRLLRVRSSWLCLFYVLSLTTDWSTWAGCGGAGWRRSTSSRCCQKSPDRAFHSSTDRSVLFACAVEVGNQQSTQDINETEDSGGNVQRIRQRKVAASSSAFIPAAAAVPTAGMGVTAKERLTLNQILYRAGKRGLGGGIPGALAGAIQVLSLMWLRTIINYQCRYGTTFWQALHTLLQDGGIPRLYRGLSFAIVQAPLARFVSTAANDGIESLLANLSWTENWGPGRTTVVASVVVGLWRMMLMPIDTMKTVLQVDSYEGFRSLMRRVRAGKIGVLYSGAIANAISAVLGHYPWFYTFNLLSGSEWLKKFLPSQLLRNAGIGLTSSIVSDTVVNAMRVIKTTKQSLGSKQTASYADTVKIILAADGWQGLFGRGLRTRIFANALQSIVFTIVWRGLKDMLKRRSDPAAKKPSEGGDKKHVTTNS